MAFLGEEFHSQLQNMTLFYLSPSEIMDNAAMRGLDVEEEGWNKQVIKGPLRNISEMKIDFLTFDDFDRKSKS